MKGSLKSKENLSKVHAYITPVFRHEVFFKMITKSKI